MKHRVEAGAATARIGTLHVRLFPARHEFVPPDDGDDRPWAWGGVVRVTFTIGEGQVTKRITARSPMGMEPPTDREALTALVSLFAEVRRLVARHGINPDDVSPRVEVEPLPVEAPPAKELVDAF